MAMTSLMPPWPVRFMEIDVHLPALALREARVHAEDLGREERGLVAAGAGADLEQDVLLVVRVLGDEEEADLGVQGVAAGLERAQLLVGHLAQLGVGLARIISWTLVSSASSAL